ncbi:Hypp321 [Branchiostoma lanceolatum]|uniref:Hypp321 protein n=1 Tax=Branchiostoma lanceolatum TaxID=7740 RepID=A0A8J9VCJ1_BRALA|nr:Hypp321 [Branchiostoma lanceolatum]
MTYVNEFCYCQVCVISRFLVTPGLDKNNANTDTWIKDGRVLTVILGGGNNRRTWSRLTDIDLNIYEFLIQENVDVQTYKLNWRLANNTNTGTCIIGGRQETRVGDKLRRKKIVIGVICAVLGVLLVVGLVKLGVHLSKDPVVKRNLRFRDGNKLYWETVETDEDEGTDTFYTESDNGAAAVMYDHNKDLKAYKFSGRDICYIVPEDEGEDEKAKEAAKELENKEEESTQASKNGGRRKMSLDESRTDAPELSEAMGLFCGDLEPRWATIELPDDDDATGGGIVLIAPDPGMFLKTHLKWILFSFCLREKQRDCFRCVSVLVSVCPCFLKHYQEGKKVSGMVSNYKSIAIRREIFERLFIKEYWKLLTNSVKTR